MRGGFFGAARLLVAVEEHGGGRQLVRLRSWPVVRLRGPVLALGFAVFALAAALDHAWVAAAVLGLGAFLPALRTLEQCTTGVATITQALRGSRLGGT